jgi:glycerol kinase
VARSLLASIDLGTTRTRALVVEAGGSILARASHPLDARFPQPGWVEQDPEQLLERSVAALRAALATARCEAADLAGLGLVTQRATAIAWNRRTGEALAPAIGWQDQRTRPQVVALAARGIPLSTQPSATKFEWLLENVPAVADAARRGELALGTPDAWLAARLSDPARPITDASEASATALFDLRTGEWNTELLHTFGLQAGWLPEIVPTTSVCGETQAHWLGAPVALAARAGDQQSACYAQGVREPGDAKLTLGTAAMLDVHVGAAPGSPPRGAYPLALWQHEGSPLALCWEGSVITAGAAIEWLHELGLLARVEDLDTIAASVPDAGGVVFVPSLQGLGTPFMDERARGWIGGLTRGTTQAQLVRAAVDGIAHRCADVCAALVAPGTAIRIDGGLSRSRILLQTLADLAGHPLLRSSEVESTAVGGAALAARALGLEGPPATTEGSERIEPRRGAAEIREAARARWRRALARAAEAPKAMR